MPAYEPPPLHQFDADGFVLPPFKAGQFPFVVAVAGGVSYTPADGRFVRRKVLNLLANKLHTHNVHFHLAPSPGAARLLYDTLDAGRKHTAQVAHRGEELWGRAWEFRAAYALLDCAHALILFEPLDLIARYAKRLAELVPGRDGREGCGVKVAVIPEPGRAGTLTPCPHPRR
jgi:hypothetical protein